MPHLDWPGLRNAAERALRIAVALVPVLVAFLALAGPGSELAARKIAEEKAAELAAAADASKRPPETAAPALPSPALAAPVLPQPTVAAPGAAAPGRNVTPPTETAALTRVAPREPLSSADPATPEATAADEVRLRLLPRPIAIDTATFLVQRGKLRLSGVQPVAPSRECGEGGAAWPCGMQARTALRLWLRARSIRCDVPENFGKENETIDAECSLGAEDVGQWLVENGWAEARADGRYTAVEMKARQAGRGIWGNGRGAPVSDTQ